MADQVDRTKFFFGIFCVLVVLTFASLIVGQFQLFEKQQTTWLVMLGISAAKASLVILFFMHFWWERSWKYLLTIPTTIMAVILVVALIPDVMERTKRYSESRWDHAAKPGVYLNHGNSSATDETASDETAH